MECHLLSPVRWILAIVDKSHFVSRTHKLYKKILSGVECNKKSRFRVAASLKTKKPQAVESAPGLDSIGWTGLVDRPLPTKIVEVVIIVILENGLSRGEGHEVLPTPCLSDE